MPFSLENTIGMLAGDKLVRRNQETSKARNELSRH